MGFFSKTKTKNTAGWMSINIQDDGVCVAHVTRRPDAKPQVAMVGFFRTDKVRALESWPRRGTLVAIRAPTCSTLASINCCPWKRPTCRRKN